MKILIVEDQEEKLLQVEQFLSVVSPAVDRLVARSFQQAKALLRKESFDLVILDMSLPMYPPGENLQPSVLVYGGEDLLAWLKPRIAGVRVAVLTQFDYFASGENPRNLTGLDESLRAEFGEMVMDVIHYQESESTWQGRLLSIINNISKT